MAMPDIFERTPSRKLSERLPIFVNDVFTSCLLRSLCQVDHMLEPGAVFVYHAITVHAFGRRGLLSQPLGVGLGSIHRERAV
nr:hypothetical protein CFP56_78083 [Quercus suber]